MFFGGLRGFVYGIYIQQANNASLLFVLFLLFLLCCRDLDLFAWADEVVMEPCWVKNARQCVVGCGIQQPTESQYLVLYHKPIPSTPFIPIPVASEDN